MGDIAEYVGIGLLCAVGVVLLNPVTLVVFVVGWLVEWLVCAVLSSVVVPVPPKHSKD